MPSPFPGMDPFLEASHRWAGVHNLLIAYITTCLNEKLPPGFAANTGERLYIEQHERFITPDSWVYRTPGTDVSVPSGGIGLLERADDMRIVEVEPDEFREPFVEIVSLAEPRRVVTVIEVLSYANKATGTEGRALYLKKQEEILNSSISLLEIDLLRRGTHTVALPVPIARSQDVYDYLICLHRGGIGRRFEYLPILMRNKLPKIPVPLAGGHPDAVLDLQDAINRTYDAGAYGRQIDYTQDFPVPLSAEDESWALSLLREKGLRPPA